MDIQELLDEALEIGETAFDNYRGGGFDAGHVMITDLDGRTKAVKAMKEHPNIRVDSGGYHGTTATLDFISGQSVGKKGRGCNAFLERMREEGHLEDAWVWRRTT